MLDNRRTQNTPSNSFQKAHEFTIDYTRDKLILQIPQCTLIRHKRKRLVNYLPVTLSFQ